MLGIALALLAATAYGVSVSPLLDVDHVAGAGRRSTSPPAEVESAPPACTPGDAMLWVDTSTAVAGIEALPYVARRRRCSGSGPTPCASPCTSDGRRRGSTGPAGKALVDGTGRVLETVDAATAGHAAARRRAASCPPPGGTVDAVGAARVAGALTGLAAVGTASVETHRPRRRAAPGVRARDPDGGGHADRA